MTVANSQKSWIAKGPEVKADWHEIDATGQILGRMANKIAVLLMGKHKASYTSHVDTGDFVIVTNVGKLVVTGKKAKQKTYENFSGFPSGRKIRTFEQVMDKNPEKVLRLAVRRMLPKTKLGRQMLSKLKIYEGNEHPHAAQQPKAFKITYGQKEALA